MDGDNGTSTIAQRPLPVGVKAPTDPTQARPAGYEGYPLVLVIAIDPSKPRNNWRTDYHGIWTGRWVATARALMGIGYGKHIKTRREAEFEARARTSAPTAAPVAAGVSDAK